MEQSIVDVLVDKITNKKYLNSLSSDAKSHYNLGIREAIIYLNKPIKPITEHWQVSICPTCDEGFYDYEECNDGYYTRAYTLERCPSCGQKLNWYD